MKVLLIGSGSIGKRHINNLLGHFPKANIILLRPNGQEDQFSQEIFGEVIHSWSEIPSDLDLVILANPSSLHATHIYKIIENNLPAYLEKPLVTSRDELEHIKKLVKIHNYKQPIMMGCNLRFLPSIKNIKDILQQRLLGKLCRAVFEAGQYLPQWRPTQDYTKSYSANAELGGGVIFDLAHELDLVRFLIGECEVVSSQYDHLSHLQINTEDTAVIHLSHSNGPFVSVHLDYVSRVPTRNIKIVGDEGTLIWDLISKEMILFSSNGEKLLSNNPQDFDVSYTYQVAMRELIECIQSRENTSQPLSEGVKTTELLFQCKNM